MHKTISILKNEEGSVIVIALLILVLLTIIGISGTNTTVTELGIVRNEAIYKQNFFRAEAAAVNAAQLLEDEDNAMLLRDLPYGRGIKQWLRNDFNDLLDPGSGNIASDANWKDEDDSTDFSEEAIDLDNRFLAFHQGVASGSTLGMDGSTLHDFSIFGRSQTNGVAGASIIEMGYRKRY